MGHGVLSRHYLLLLGVPRSPVEDEAQYPHTTLWAPLLSHAKQAAARRHVPAPNGSEHARNIERFERARQLLR